MTKYLQNYIIVKFKEIKKIYKIEKIYYFKLKIITRRIKKTSIKI
jgi:hypothetical protein